MSVQNQLDAKLDAAIAALDADNKNSVSTLVNRLQAFVNAVEADARTGRISCADSTALIDAA